jgi:putative transposase
MRAGKLVIKVSAHHTSQECADCRHIHPDNRPSQAVFACQVCDHRDNADNNAAKIIKKRAIKLIRDSGTELSERGVLRRRTDTGQGAGNKTRKANACRAAGDELSKKTKNKGSSEAAPL